LRALHQVSAYVAEYGLTPGQRACEEKSNEITAIQDLMLQPWGDRSEHFVDDSHRLPDSVRCRRRICGILRRPLAVG
jgi:hypothetical protein